MKQSKSKIELARTSGDVEHQSTLKIPKSTYLLKKLNDDTVCMCIMETRIL